MSVEQSDVVSWGAVAAGLGFAARYVVTWLGRQGMIQAGDTSQRTLIESLTAEAAKWEARYEVAVREHQEDRALHTATVTLLNETRNQNKMLRMLLIQRGMTAEELDKALEIDTRMLL